MIEEHPILTFLGIAIGACIILGIIGSIIGSLPSDYSSTPKYETRCLEVGYDDYGNYRCIRADIIK